MPLTCAPTTTTPPFLPLSLSLFLPHIPLCGNLRYFYFAFVDVFPSLKKFGHLITVVQVTQFYSCIIMAMNVEYQIDIAKNVDCPNSSFWHRMWVCWLYVSFQGMFMLFDRARKARMRASKDKKKDTAKAQ